jgi:hypothetical protein
MSDWMLYVYKQFSRPADTTGVKIKFAAIDPTGNHKDLGEAISNSYGSYGFEFKPEDEGQYMITATFEGSNSYYPSTAVTYLSVVPAAEKLDIPTVDEIAQTTVSQMPAYPTPPTADEIAQETVNQMPAYPEPTTCPEIPAYLTIDIVSILLVVIILIIGLYCCFVKKQK